MSIKLEELKIEEPITTHLPLPCGSKMLERYRKIQHDLHRKNMKGLHSFARERLKDLMSELERLLEAA